MSKKILQKIQNSKKKQWKKNDIKSFSLSLKEICFSDENKDLISQDFCLEKDKVKKKQQKKKISEKFEDDIYELTEEQKLTIKKNSIIKERLMAIDKILELYPNLKKDKVTITDVVLGKKEIKKKQYVLEKLNIKDKNYYRDTNGNIVNEKAILVGFCIDDNKNELYTKYSFFDEFKKIKAKIIRNKNKIDKTYL